jgi:hypothetical protein
MKIHPDLHNDPRLFASLLHAHSGKFYDDYVYVYHLDMVAQMFRELELSRSGFYELFVVYFHDTIEDCGLTYNDVKSYASSYVSRVLPNDPHQREKLSEHMADAVFRLTNLRGKTRPERQNDEWYDSLVQNDLAVRIKYADKFANLIHSSNTKSSMRGVYHKEWNEFHEKVMKRVTDKRLIAQLEYAWSIVVKELESPIKA